MSVDDQLHTAFRTTDQSWEPATEAALRDVVRRHRRGVRLRRTAVVGAVAAVTVGVVLLGGGPLRDESAPDPITPPSSPTPSFGITVLEGRWRTPPLDEAAVREALAVTGDEAFADQVVAGLPATPFRIVWEVERGIATLSAVSDGDASVLDQIALVVEDDTVTLSPRFAEGSTVHGFVIDGDELRLTFVSTTEGVQQDGVPGEVWQRLLYDAAAFTRG